MSETLIGAARRFYQTAQARACESGFGVYLDERALKTPAGARFTVPSLALARLSADEWDAVKDVIIPARMPVTRLINVAIDRAPGAREDLADHMVKYLETDLVCHRARAPEALVLRQGAHWDPIVDWARETLGSAPAVVPGAIAADPPLALMERVRAQARDLDQFRLTGLSHAAGLTGSALIALGMLHGALDAGQAFSAAALDELWSLETWGEDAEARARLDLLAKEIEAVAKYLNALQEVQA